MTEQDIRQSIPGADSFIEWFGCWPDFHDSEVLRCDLKRAGETLIDVHTFKMTRDVDERGFFVLEKHALVSFHLNELVGMQLRHFNDQNALSGLELERCEENFKISFGPAHGLEGFITARKLHLEWAPGKPTEGIYAN